MNSIDLQSLKQELPEFREKTLAFYAGELDKGTYKGFSGFYGSYAQRGGTANMLRLRIPCGQMTKERLSFTADVLRKYNVTKLHFSTCQTVQLHNLEPDTVFHIMEEALDAGIITMGGGGDYPRNVMCSPLSGVEYGEYFDVLPWALAASDYLLSLLKAEKMPRKLKVCFSNSPKNLTHATYRDLGFAARPDGRFDVYSAGGLGNQPRMGVLVAEGAEPEKVLYYIKAMWLTFLAHGNYKNRGKARTRFMQESLGGSENYVKAYQEKLEEAMASDEALIIHPKAVTVSKSGDGTELCGPWILPQKQQGLFTVIWHPIGGLPTPEEFCAVSDAVCQIPEAQLRLGPDETAYIINLTGTEAEAFLKLTDNSAKTLFETSVSCIGAGVCQIGIRDSQALLSACVQAVRDAHIPNNALPQIHISGCPSSCGTHQTGTIGFRGGAKKIDGSMQPTFTLFVNGNEKQGQEAMGQELGMLLENQIPEFLIALGKTTAESGKTFAQWNQEDPEAIKQVAARYLI